MYPAASEMNTRRMGQGVAVLGSVIVAVGGCAAWTSSNWLCGRVVASTETYDVSDPYPRWNQNTSAPMTRARWGLGVGVIEERIYAFGGVGAVDGRAYDLVVSVAEGESLAVDLIGQGRRWAQKMSDPGII